MFIINTKDMFIIKRHLKISNWCWRMTFVVGCFYHISLLVSIAFKFQSDLRRKNENGWGEESEKGDTQKLGNTHSSRLMTRRTLLLVFLCSLCFERECVPALGIEPGG